MFQQQANVNFTEIYTISDSENECNSMLEENNEYEFNENTTLLIFQFYQCQKQLNKEYPLHQNRIVEHRMLSLSLLGVPRNTV